MDIDEKSITTTQKPAVVSKPFYRKVKNFLNNAYYMHYRSFLKLDFAR
jgi:hypothetical protein